MGITQAQREDHELRDQIADWCDEMMQVTPVEKWGNELVRLLETWADEYGVVFTDESYDALQEWMYREQQAEVVAQEFDQEEIDLLSEITLEATDRSLFDPVVETADALGGGRVYLPAAKRDFER